MSMRRIEPLGWSIIGSKRWGWTVRVTDREERAAASLCLFPTDNFMYSWASPEQAREKAVSALRELADRIEKG